MRELKVATERKTQLLDVTDRVHAALEGAEGSIPLENGRLALGRLQAVFLAELDGPRERTRLLAITR